MAPRVRSSLPFRGGWPRSGRVGCLLKQFCVNHLEHTVDILVDIVIPETKDQIALLLQRDVTQVVKPFVFVEIVLPAIQFHNDARPPALEVGDVAADWRLTAKMKTELAKKAKPLPEPHLLASHRLAQLPGALVRHA